MITLDQSWKERNNNSELTTQELIENTIQEEMEKETKSILSGQRERRLGQNYHYKNAYYRAIAILQELL
jgi:hypothetical protein